MIMTSNKDGLDSLGLVVFLGVICGVSVIVNLVVVFVIVLWKEFRTVTDVFIGNLAASSIILAGIAIPLKVNQSVIDNEHFLGTLHLPAFFDIDCDHSDHLDLLEPEDVPPASEFGYTDSQTGVRGDITCKLLMFLPLFSIMASICTLVAISFDRMFTICHNTRLSRRGQIFSLVFIWAMALATSAPQLYEYSVYEYWDHSMNRTLVACGSHELDEHFETIYSAIVVVIAYIIPLILIIVNYIVVGRFLWAASHSQTQVHGTISRHKVKILKVLVLCSVTFAILWAPYFVIFTMEEVTGLDDTAQANPGILALKQTFIVLSTITNSLLYTSANSRFRAAFIYICSCKALMRKNFVVPAGTNETSEVVSPEPALATNPPPTTASK